MKKVVDKPVLIVYRQNESYLILLFRQLYFLISRIVPSVQWSDLIQELIVDNFATWDVISSKSNPFQVIDLPNFVVFVDRAPSEIFARYAHA